MLLLWATAVFCSSLMETVPTVCYQISPVAAAREHTYSHANLSINVLNWAAPETRTWVWVVYLRDNPKIHWEKINESRKRRKLIKDEKEIEVKYP